MATSVFEVLHDNKRSLLEKLTENQDLCNFVLGFVGRCICITAERGLPLEGIQFGPVEAEDLTNGDASLRARVIFNQTPQTAASIWPPQSDFARYVRSKAHGMGIALQKNPNLNHFFQSLIERIDQYATHKGVQFGKLKVQKAIITTADILVLQVGKNVPTN